MSADEVFPLVDLDGRVIGSARRGDVHGNPALLHPVVHCLVENGEGQLLLQLRSVTKDVQPGRWDTSMGGHVMLNESIDDAVVRELGEELGLDVSRQQLTFLYRYVMRSPIETELVHTFLLRCDGPFRAQPDEISEVRFFTEEAIDRRLGMGDFTPNFEDEYRRFLIWKQRTGTDLSLGLP